MKFAEHFPRQCPPVDSSDASGTVYRLICGDLPQKKDFESYWVTKPKCRQKWAKEGLDCKACGLSVYTDIKDLKKTQKIVPAVRKIQKIAKGILEPNMGKIKSTTGKPVTSHHTWWVPLSLEDPSTFFEVVA